MYYVRPWAATQCDMMAFMPWEEHFPHLCWICNDTQMTYASVAASAEFLDLRVVPILQLNLGLMKNERQLQFS